MAVAVLAVEDLVMVMGRGTRVLGGVVFLGGVSSGDGMRWEGEVVVQRAGKTIPTH